MAQHKGVTVIKTGFESHSENSIFSFFRSGIEGKCGVKFNHSTHHASRIQELLIIASSLQYSMRDAQRQYIHSSIETSNPSKTWKFPQSLGIGRQPSTISNFQPLLFSWIARKNLILPTIIYSLPIPSYPSFHYVLVNCSEIQFHILAIKSNATGNDGIDHINDCPNS